MRLSDQETPTAINRLANHFAADLVKLDRIFLELDGKAQRTERYEDQRTMHALHAIRQALIVKALMLVATLPSFSQRHDVPPSTLFELAFQRRFDELADLAEQIFPGVDASAAALSGIEEESDEWDAAKRAYPESHRNIIEPLRQIHQIIREIAVGLSHHYCEYG